MKVYIKLKQMSSMKSIVSQMKITNDNIYFMSEIKLDLVDFLLKSMSDKGLVPADITKRTGLSASQVSKILNRESPAGTKAIDCFAQALSLPVDILYQYAGRLSKPLKQDERREELVHLYGMLDEDNREDTIDYARMKLEKQSREVNKSGKRDKVA